MGEVSGGVEEVVDRENRGGPRLYSKANSYRSC